MTKNELIFTVFEKLQIESDDTDISSELVSSLLDSKRALLLKQQYSGKGWNIPREVKQELCLSTKLVDSVSGYSCAGKILQTNEELPKTIKIKGKEGPLLVRKPDNTVIALNVVPVERLPYLFSNKFTAMLTYCAVDYDGKLLLISADNKLKFLKSIKVTDVFEAPGMALDFECKNVNPNVDPFEIEYPMEAGMADAAINMVVQELTRSLMLPGDEQNDATDDRGQVQQPRRRRA